MKSTLLTMASAAAVPVLAKPAQEFVQTLVIQAQDQDPLQFCEVELTLASGVKIGKRFDPWEYATGQETQPSYGWWAVQAGAPRMSSTKYDASATRAIDGNTNTKWSAGGCVHSYTGATWSIDINTGTDPVALVEIFHRDDCCHERNDGVKVAMYINSDAATSVEFDLRGDAQAKPAVYAARNPEVLGGPSAVGVSDDIVGADFLNRLFVSNANGNMEAINGRLVQVDMAKGRTGNVYVGVASDNTLWQRDGTDGEWTKVSGILKQLSLANSGEEWGISTQTKDNIWYYDPAKAAWEGVAGTLSQVQVSKDGEHIWGVQSSGKIFYRKGREGTWTLVPGTLAQVSVSGTGEHVWGVQSNGSVFYRAGFEGKWIPIEGAKLQQLSVSSTGEHVWGLSEDGSIWYNNGLVRGPRWTQVPGTLRSIASA